MPPAKRKQIYPIEKAIEAALSPGNFISYNASWSFVDDVQSVANDIGEVITKEPERAVRLYEIFIAACHRLVFDIVYYADYSSYGYPHKEVRYENNSDDPG